MSYDNWLTKGADRDQADWEEWSGSAMAEEAYAAYLFTHDWPMGDPSSFEDWLNTDDAEDAFDAAKYPAFDNYLEEPSYDVV